MKKFVFSLALVLACIPIAGCSTTSDANTLNALNNQLSRVENIVQTTSSTEVNSVSPYISKSATSNDLSSYKSEAYFNMTREENLRQDVLSLNSKLKNSQNQYKLGKQKCVALNTLTSNLSKYLNYLNNTKSEVKNNVNTITKYSKGNTYNTQIAKSSYTALSNLMNERIVYLDNIHATLGEIEIILNGAKISTTITEKETNNISEQNNVTHEKEITNCDDCKNDATERDCKNCDNDNKINNNKTTEFNSKQHTIFQPNIDTYSSKANEKTQENNTSIKNDNTETKTNQTQNINQPAINNYPVNYPSVPPTNYGMNGYNYPVYGYGYGYNNWGMNRFNPGRNTDTFYPYMRNIDTYRLPPNFNNAQGYGMGPNTAITTPQNGTLPVNQTENTVQINQEKQIKEKTDTITEKIDSHTNQDSNKVKDSLKISTLENKQNNVNNENNKQIEKSNEKKILNRDFIYENNRMKKDNDPIRSVPLKPQGDEKELNSNDTVQTNLLQVTKDKEDENRRQVI